MQTCYRHGDRKAGRHLPALRPADLPELHAPGLGGLPLPRVHQVGRPEDRPGRASSARGPVVTYALIAINVVDLRRRRRLRARRPGTRWSSTTASSARLRRHRRRDRRGGRASGTGSSPAASCTPTSSTSAFNMLALYQLGLLLEPAFGRLRFAVVYIVSLLGRLARRDAPAPRRPHGGRVRRRVRADGLRLHGDARPRHRPVLHRARRHDRDQPRHHLHAVELHLGRAATSAA